MNKSILIKKVSKILWENEKVLSDGFELYHGNYSDTIISVDNISKQVIDNLFEEHGWTKEKPTTLGYYWVWSHHYPKLLCIMTLGETNRDGPGFFDQEYYMKVEKPDFPVN